MPEHVVVGRKAAAGHADEMEAVELKIICKRVEIVGDGAWLRSRVRIRRTPAPAASVKSDNPKACLDKAWNVVLPAVGVAGVRVQQHQRNAASAAVAVPEAHARELSVSGEAGGEACAAAAIVKNSDPSPADKPSSAAAARPIINGRVKSSASSVASTFGADRS